MGRFCLFLYDLFTSSNLSFVIRYRDPTVCCIRYGFGNIVHVNFDSTLNDRAGHDSDNCCLEYYAEALRRGLFEGFGIGSHSELPE